MKVVINQCYGGFGLSLLAQKRYCDLDGKEVYFYKSRRFGDPAQKTDVNDAGLNVYLVYQDYGEEVILADIPDEMFFNSYNLRRNDPILVQVVEELEDLANASCSKLKIVEAPDDVMWAIEEYDGVEWVAEKHRTWE